MNIGKSIKMAKAEKTLKNWRWWVVLIPVVVALAFAFFMQCLFFVFDFLARSTDITSKPSPKFFKLVVKWVHQHKKG
tara:strand:+ start:652 stop:882 length:231 start_codon:yes stop_codon:yes gene_type:complete